MADHQVVDITAVATGGEQFPPRLMQLGFRLLQVVDAAGHEYYRYVVSPSCAVPAGPFLMGRAPRDVLYATDDTQPQHEVTVSAFHIGRYPVTVAEFACAVVSGAVSEAGTSSRWQEQLPDPDHPVVGLTWGQAQDYASWLTTVTGQPWRLPTEAEWEKAARGTDGRRFPWGDAWDATRTKDYTQEGSWGTIMPVGSYAHDGSPYGVQDMVGSVMAWTSSLYRPYPYATERSENEADRYVKRVLRGSSWNFSPQPVTSRFTFLGGGIRNDVGVRLARSRATDTD